VTKIRDWFTFSLRFLSCTFAVIFLSLVAICERNDSTRMVTECTEYALFE
jgi:hypothetical protein